MKKPATTPSPKPAFKPIRIIGARQNNLKNISLEIPSRKLTVITGLSGSGKSSLAFDTLYVEGQRRYIDSLSTYTRQFMEKLPRPDVDALENIPPSIALEQRNHVLNSRSIVGTQTEIVDLMRVIWSRVGKTSCLDCGSEVVRMDGDRIAREIANFAVGRKVALTAPLETSTQGLASRSLTALLAEQGFDRVLTPQSEGTAPLVRELSELSTPLNDVIEVVIDRIRARTLPTGDALSRLADSVQQALAVGGSKCKVHDLESGESKQFEQAFACVRCAKRHIEPEANLFSSNSPLGACPRCSGFGYTLELSESKIVPDPSKTLKNGAIDPLSKPSLDEWQTRMFRFAERAGISIGTRYRDLKPRERQLLWEGDTKDRSFTGIRGCFEHLAQKKYKLHVRVFIRRYQDQSICPECKGARLQPAALAVRIAGKTLPEVLDMPITESLLWSKQVREHLTESDRQTAREALSQWEQRLHYLDAVGVGYLTLSRQTRTLSGGEFQRITLASQLGHGLCGTLYVLDEPSIGLHAADTQQLIGVVKNLRDLGNTVVVVEHDPEFIRAADHLIEMGPGAGKRGGQVISSGSPSYLSQIAQISPEAASLTGKYLAHHLTLKPDRPTRPPARKHLNLIGCNGNNLQNITVDIPLERFVVVTGVSGSGKSTLIHQTLHPALEKIFSDPNAPQARSNGHDIAIERITGAEQVSGVVLLDQKPIGRSSRSNPATYLKIWNEIRTLYANQVTAIRRGYTAQTFSFNVEGGRCSVCQGEGSVTLDMHFMADVHLPCEECKGRRFKKSVLEITYRGRNVDDLLHMTVDEAYDQFRDHPLILRKLSVLKDVGLGYLLLGQSGATLSGGEAQRLKIAGALDHGEGQNLLYLFDEPTTGLHLEDVRKLLNLIHDLVDARHSVIMVEHHLDVIAHADWVIDLGPGGGKNGGQLIAEGPPSLLIENEASVTGRMLRQAALTNA